MPSVLRIGNGSTRTLRRGAVQALRLTLHPGGGVHRNAIHANLEVGIFGTPGRERSTATEPLARQHDVPGLDIDRDQVRDEGEVVTVVRDQHGSTEAVHEGRVEDHPPCWSLNGAARGRSERPPGMRQHHAGTGSGPVAKSRTQGKRRWEEESSALLQEHSIR